MKTILKSSCTRAIELKRRGVLTVEVMLLTLVILAVGGLVLSAQLRIERHNQVFELIDAAGKDTAKSLYALMRLKSGILEDGKVIEQSHYSALAGLIGVQLNEVGAQFSQQLIKRMLDGHLLSRAKVANMAEFQAQFGLAAALDYEIQCEPRALVIDVVQSYRSSVSWLPMGNVKFSDRHIIPLSEAHSLIVGRSETQYAVVTITNFGKNHTHVYHTADCFGLRSAKQKYQHRVDADLIGGDIEIEGVQYSHCYFCRIKR